MDQHAGGKWLIHDTKRRKDGSRPTTATMLEGIFHNFYAYQLLI